MPLLFHGHVNLKPSSRFTTFLACHHQYRVPIPGRRPRRAVSASCSDCRRLKKGSRLHIKCVCNTFDVFRTDTVHNSDGELKTAVYCADLSTLDVTLYKEDAQCPVFDGKELWVIAKEGDACVLVNTESSEKIPVPNDVAEIAIGDSIFFKLNRGTLENDEFATTELVEAQSNQPIMITQLSIDDLRLEEGVLVWTSYVDASVFLFDTQSDCFLCFESLPQGFHSLRFYQGHGLLQVGTDGAIHYYRLSKK